MADNDDYIKGWCELSLYLQMISFFVVLTMILGALSIIISGKWISGSNFMMALISIASAGAILGVYLSACVYMWDRRGIWRILSILLSGCVVVVLEIVLNIVSMGHVGGIIGSIIIFGLISVGFALFLRWIFLLPCKKCCLECADKEETSQQFYAGIKL